MSKIKYNKDNKIISIRLSRKKSVDSDVQNNVIVDYDASGNIVNIDIMNIDFNEFISNKINFTDIIQKKVYATTNSKAQTHNT